MSPFKVDEIKLHCSGFSFLCQRAKSAFLFVTYYHNSFIN